MSPLLAHLLWLSTPLVAGILTIVFPAWKVTTFLAGVAVGVGIGAALWVGFCRGLHLDACRVLHRRMRQCDHLGGWAA